MDTIAWAARFLLLLGMLIQTGMGLKCFICKDEPNNELCSRPDDVIDCDSISTPTTKYDTCQTMVTRSPDHGIKVTKKCAVGPCALGSDQSVALGLQCDRSTPTWYCEECCKSDECNYNTAPSTRHVTKLGWVVMAAAAILVTLLTRGG